MQSWDIYRILIIYHMMMNMLMVIMHAMPRYS